MESNKGEYVGGQLVVERGGVVVAPATAVVNREDQVVTALHQRAMAAIRDGKNAIMQLLPEVDGALVVAYNNPQDNAEIWCKLFELKAILHTHLNHREDAPEEGAVTTDFGMTLSDYFKEACVQKKLDFLKSILKLIKLRQMEKYPAELRVDMAFIKTVLDVCVDSDNFDVVGMIIANFPEEFKDYIASKISTKSFLTALDLYGSSRGNTIPAFLVAVSRGDVIVVENCLLNGNHPDLNACDRHIPALHAAVESGQPEVVRLLLEAGANINLSYRGKTALSIAMSRNNLDLVSMLLSNKKFDWRKNDLVLDTLETYLTSSNDTETAKKIVLLILENIASTKTLKEIKELLIGETPLSMAIKVDRDVAGTLIEKGIGVFDLNAEGHAPSYCITQARDEGLMKALKSYYERHCKEITTLFLNADPRVCRQLPGQSSCVLVLPLVNNWLELKQNVFDEISHRVKNPHTTCAELEKIRDQIKNPKGPLMQFFGIGHGSHFWQSASPWPEKLYPLLDTIKARVAHAYRIVPASNQKK